MTNIYYSYLLFLSQVRTENQTLMWEKLKVARTTTMTKVGSPLLLASPCCAEVCMAAGRSPDQEIRETEMKHCQPHRQWRTVSEMQIARWKVCRCSCPRRTAWHSWWPDGSWFLLHFLLRQWFRLWNSTEWFNRENSILPLTNCWG